MSYILNALKKAESKGFAAENQKIKKQILVLKRRNRHGKFKILILVTVLLGALFCGWLLGQSRQPRTENEAASVADYRDADHSSPAPVSQNPVAAEPLPRVDSKTMTETPSSNTLPVQTSAKISTKLNNERVEVSPPIPVRAAVQIQQKRQPQVEPQLTAPAFAEADIEEFLPNYSELPQMIKQRLPALKISLHFYNSSPPRRLVRINGKILHENERIDNELIVEEITPRGTVLNYAGYLFELDAPGG